MFVLYLGNAKCETKYDGNDALNLMGLIEEDQLEKKGKLVPEVILLKY